MPAVATAPEKNAAAIACQSAVASPYTITAPELAVQQRYMNVM